jgi:hypothetical protein
MIHEPLNATGHEFVPTAPPETGKDAFEEFADALLEWAHRDDAPSQPPVEPEGGGYTAQYDELYETWTVRRHGEFVCACKSDAGMAREFGWQERNRDLGKDDAERIARLLNAEVPRV